MTSHQHLHPVKTITCSVICMIVNHLWSGWPHMDQPNKMQPQYSHASCDSIMDGRGPSIVIVTAKTVFAFCDIPEFQRTPRQPIYSVLILYLLCLMYIVSTCVYLVRVDQESLVHHPARSSERWKNQNSRLSCPAINKLWREAVAPHVGFIHSCLLQKCLPSFLGNFCLYFSWLIWYIRYFTFPTD